MKRIDFIALLSEAENGGLNRVRKEVAELVEKYKHNKKMLIRIKRAIHDKVETTRLSLNDPRGYIYLSLAFKYRNL